MQKKKLTPEIITLWTVSKNLLKQIDVIKVHYYINFSTVKRDFIF